MRHAPLLAAAALAAGLAACPARAGTFATINIDGDFADWSAVPVFATDAADGAPIDLVELKVANDADNVYALLTFAGPVNPQSGSGTFTAIDTDDDAATGFDIFGLGAAGSNTGFQNNFPFTQAAGAFNTGGTLSSASRSAAGSDLYLASPYATVTTMQEIALPLDLFQTDGSAGGFSGSVFDDTFALAFYSTDGAGDFIGGGPYTLAAVPEPATAGLLAAAAAGLVVRRRRA